MFSILSIYRIILVVSEYNLSFFIKLATYIIKIVVLILITTFKCLFIL